MTRECFNENVHKIPMAFSSLLPLLFVSLCVLAVVSFARRAPCLFIFGDSLVDGGNNNFIFSLAKADTKPFGIDFIQSGRRPTGRFTNGKTVMDLIGDEFGSTCYPPPYLGPNANEAAATCGVNYASGAAGILNKTGYVFVGRINMDAQIDNFANTQQLLISSLGMEKALKLLKSSFFTITIGSNDFLNNYLIPIISVGIRKLLPPEVFIEQLITRYRFQLKRLYSLGARKIIVVNVGPIGCIPYQREINPLSGDNCVADTNQLATAFNRRLKDLIIELNSNLPDVRLCYANVYRIVSDLLQGYMNYGFEVADSACCKVAGRFGGLIQCGTKATYCPDRSKYFFWDPYHPSEAANRLIVNRLMDGENEDIYPLNLRQIIQQL